MNRSFLFWFIAIVALAAVTFFGKATILNFFEGYLSLSDKREPSDLDGEVTDLKIELPEEEQEKEPLSEEVLGEATEEPVQENKEVSDLDRIESEVERVEREVEIIESEVENLQQRQKKLDRIEGELMEISDQIEDISLQIEALQASST